MGDISLLKLMYTWLKSFSHNISPLSLRKTHIILSISPFPRHLLYLVNFFSSKYTGLRSKVNNAHSCPACRLDILVDKTHSREIFNGVKEFMIQCHIINPARLSKHIDNNKYFSVESCPHRPHKGGSSATIGHVAITWPRSYSANLFQNFPSGFKTDAFSLFNGKSTWEKKIFLCNISKVYLEDLVWNRMVAHFLTRSWSLFSQCFQTKGAWLTSSPIVHH